MIRKEGNHQSNDKLSLIKKSIIVTSTAVLLGIGTIGSSIPATAAPRIDGFNEKAAIEQGYLYKPNLSVKHDGITLTLTDVRYDGSTLSFALRPEGANLDFPFTSDPEKEKIKGYIKPDCEVLADGKPIAFSSSDANGANKSLQYFAKGVKLPDEFELSIKAEVTKVKEAFDFKVPVKLKSKPLVVKPDASKTSGKFSYTVKQLVLSPFSTRLILDSQGPVPASAEQSGKYHASPVYYELLDNNGNEIAPEMIGFFNKKPETKYHIDKFYYPMDDKATSITIKPYTYTINSKNWAILEEKGSNGKMTNKKTYLKDLELTIPIKTITQK
ncbi:DUF4179 domain-containing protein [Paenibacillus alvei]|uniref:DUF4179 domain-containing protein n=1 Tax=Paenibacillus alvei TaxID=44250 RepID=A0ABT4GVR7_PAEAL|nr:DUF4179 domain-containing protein [Paenibacillus alvei]MCY9544779.1 DUF4179 domain-containing protein [Paenibacillus alvei]MCY9702973.1 DUF4179 domain-containing protein [Paenibacillus alvei]MCY9733288.1 DUF4179 domain-containing protein [Paenibacillus alvei]MCY9754155.1 DUF4179 domain-containing protein [Paenibacillus alvei]MCY9760799.1 DUF4179 domain-containing protein [Paenibacillus alvei]